MWTRYNRHVRILLLYLEALSTVRPPFYLRLFTYVNIYVFILNELILAHSAIYMFNFLSTELILINLAVAALKRVY